MMKYSIYLILALTSLISFSADAKDYSSLVKLCPEITTLSQCDTLINIQGYLVHLIMENNNIKEVAFNLFTDEMKSSMGKELLESIESKLAQTALGLETEGMAEITFKKGSVADFKEISHMANCSISNTNAKNITIDWNKGKTVITLPVSYQTVNGGKRSDIEQKFIDDVHIYNGNREHQLTLNIKDAEPHGKELYVIPGASYQNKNITQNVYLESDSIITPIWDDKYPLESISNLFIYPSDKYCNPNVKLTVLKHEIGDKETVTVTLNHLMSYCEKTGCTPFWGVEKFEQGKLEGALFLFNRNQGYDHVFKVTCTPNEVIDGKGTIEMRASLFVPTNNVNNLFEPYRKKSDKERIRYDK